MILIAKLTKTVSFSLSEKDKEKLQQKAKELGIPLAAMIRNIVLKKYKNLAICYITPVIRGRQEINIRKLKLPQTVMKPKTKDEMNFKECINQLKDVFNNGINILGKLEDSELGIKPDNELNVLSQESEERMVIRQEKVKDLISVSLM